MSVTVWNALSWPLIALVEATRAGFRALASALTSPVDPAWLALNEAQQAPARTPSGYCYGTGLGAKWITPAGERWKPS